MTDSPCPCRYDPDQGAIIFCSLHSAAGELLEACKRALDALELEYGDGCASYLTAAIQKASRTEDEGSRS